RGRTDAWAAARRPADRAGAPAEADESWSRRISANGTTLILAPAPAAGRRGSDGERRFEEHRFVAARADRDEVDRHARLLLEKRGVVAGRSGQLGQAAHARQRLVPAGERLVDGTHAILVADLVDGEIVASSASRLVGDADLELLVPGE